MRGFCTPRQSRITFAIIFLTGLAFVTAAFVLFIVQNERTTVFIILLGIGGVFFLLGPFVVCFEDAQEPHDMS